MARRINNDVTLTHEEALALCKLLDGYASTQNNHARRTRSLAVREYCERTSYECRVLAEKIVRNLWTWEEN